MKAPAELTQWYETSFEDLEKNLNGEAGSAFHALRKKGWSAFRNLGFPTQRHEEWKFTNIAPISSTPFKPVTARRKVTVSQSDLGDAIIAENRLVFIDGHYEPSLSNVKGVSGSVVAASLAHVLKKDPAVAHAHLGSYAPLEEHSFVALNTAFASDGAFLSVPDDGGSDKPIQILFVATGNKDDLISPRNLFLVGKNARLSVIESYLALNDAAYLTNAVTELVIGPGAVVEHDKLQMESTAGYHVSWMHAVQAERSTLVSNLIALGGSIARSNVHVVFDGEHAESTLNGLSLGTGSQLIDNHTAIDHARAHCASHELYKAVLDGRSRGVFNGKIFVRKDAQKTDAKQTNKTLLLSEEAVMDTKPQLEIFADDVKCTHGATVGQLDDDQLFYLRSRGIGSTEARDILTFAFAADVVERVHAAGLKGKLEALVHAKLDSGRKA